MLCGGGTPCGSPTLAHGLLIYPRTGAHHDAERRDPAAAADITDIRRRTEFVHPAGDSGCLFQRREIGPGAGFRLDAYQSYLARAAFGTAAVAAVVGTGDHFDCGVQHVV